MKTRWQWLFTSFRTSMEGAFQLLKVKYEVQAPVTEVDLDLLF